MFTDKMVLHDILISPYTKLIAAPAYARIHTHKYRATTTTTAAIATITMHCISCLPVLHRIIIHILEKHQK